MRKAWLQIARVAWRLRVRRAAFALTIAVFCLLVTNIWLNFRSTRDSVGRDLRIVRAGGQLALLDEVLTMSARMSALTGDPMWETRYIESERKLDVLFSETLLIVPAPLADTLRQTQHANQLLVDAERRAIGLASRGELEQARVLVWSPEYEENKLVYSRALRESIDMLQAQAGRNVNSARLLALASTFAASIGIMMSFMLFLAGLERYRREQRLRHELALHLRRGTVERLALGLTHELGQPLAAIGHYADAADETIEGASNVEALPEMIRGIKLQASRAAAIVQRTRDFATSGTQQKRAEIDLNL